MRIIAGRWRGHTIAAPRSGKTRPNGRVVNENSVCTDCHGTHTTIHDEKSKTGQIHLTTK